MWSNKNNSLWLHKLDHWLVAISYKLSDAGFWCRLCIYVSSIECHHLARQKRFFGGTPVCLVPSPWGRRLSRVYSSSPRWPSAVLGRVSMGPGGRKPASPLPWGSRHFTSVPKVIIALRYGIKSYKSFSAGQQRFGLGGNKSRWGGGTSGNAWN